MNIVGCDTCWGTVALMFFFPVYSGKKKKKERKKKEKKKRKKERQLRVTVPQPTVILTT